MKLIVIILGILLCSCASVRIDPELAPYVPAEIKNVTFEFGPMYVEGHAAECHLLDINPNIVRVHLATWKTLSEAQKQWLINHEIGHCHEGLSHDNELDSEGCPVSKMFRHIPEDRCIGRQTR